VPNLVVLESN
jgi:hypothetical protein